MTPYIIYDINTGVIARVGECPADTLPLQPLYIGEARIVGRADPVTDYVRDGAVVPYPPRPTGAHWVWSGDDWVDPRTPADLAAALQARRAGISLDKANLLIRLVEAHLLPAADAAEAARGIIPPSMAAMIETLPPAARTAAEIKWAADTSINRLHPVILAAAYAMGLTDAQVDQIFGVPCDN